MRMDTLEALCARLAWLLVAGRGLFRRQDALRAGVFVACLVHLWPIASSSSAFDLYTSGIFFMTAGGALRSCSPATSRVGTWMLGRLARRSKVTRHSSARR